LFVGQQASLPNNHKPTLTRPCGKHRQQQLQKPMATLDLLLLCCQISNIQSIQKQYVNLTPKGPRAHGLKMTNSIDHSVRNKIQMGPNYMSPASEKKIACVRQKIK